MLTAFESKRCLMLAGTIATLAVKESEPVVPGTVAGTCVPGVVIPVSRRHEPRV